VAFHGPLCSLTLGVSQADKSGVLRESFGQNFTGPF